MFKPPESAIDQVRKGGVAGNGRLTAALFGTGVALLIVGPNGELSFLHKVSFIAWFALMAIHILELPGPALADLSRHGSRLTGTGLRLAAVSAALAIGAGLALVSLSAAGSWG